MTRSSRKKLRTGKCADWGGREKQPQSGVLGTAKRQLASYVGLTGAAAFFDMRISLMILLHMWITAIVYYAYGYLCICIRYAYAMYVYIYIYIYIHIYIYMYDLIIIMIIILIIAITIIIMPNMSARSWCASTTGGPARSSWGTHGARW